MIRIKVFVFLLCISLTSILSAQDNPETLTISGVVMDAQTHEPVVSASVFLPDFNLGAGTDVNGRFHFQTKAVKTLKGKKLRVSLIGYKTEFVTLGSRLTGLEIKLDPTSQNLGQVEVKKQKYQKKNNPAVELIENVIKNKKNNRIKYLPYYQDDKYEKVQFALNKITPEFTMKKIFRQFQFVFENIDSVDGERCLPIYLKESLYRDYHSKSPKEDKTLNVAHKSVALNGFDNRGIEDKIKFLYQDIDIYENNIPMMSNQILSPLAPNATIFYRYYILDTVQVGDSKCVKMYFAPKNKEDLLFQGHLYVSMDSTFGIRKVELAVSKTMNINWVDNIKVMQEFARKDSVWVPSSDKISMRFGLTKKGRGIIGQKSVTYYNYAFSPQTNDTIANKKNLASDDPRLRKSDEFWVQNRPEKLTKTEAGVYQALDSLQKVPLFKRVVDIGTVFLFGYKNMGWYEIGPINTFYMYNPVEGVRFRLGGRTTDVFSKKFNLETYAAYGLLDKQWKYYVGGTWSLTERNFLQFPVKSIKASIQQETQLPGQQMKFLMEDNFLLSIKRGVNDKLFYNKTFTLEHLNEFENHFSYTLGYKFTQMRPGGSLSFNYTDYLSETNDVGHLNISEFNVVLRYAPHESFYQGKTFRIPNYGKYPIFELRYTAGNKLWGNDYNYHSLKLNIHKRFYMSVLGYSDVVWEAGKIFGKVPYPLLNLPQANQSYSYQIESYNMMNFLEFATDQYTSLMFDHAFNGFFLNKIPLIKKLGLREYISGKMLYGKITDTNDPAKNTDLFRFPVEGNGTPLTYSLSSKPYIEGSVGIGNIFKIFRIDLVRRFTYLDNPNAPKWGIRTRFRFDF